MWCTRAGRRPGSLSWRARAARSGTCRSLSTRPSRRAVGCQYSPGVFDRNAFLVAAYFRCACGQQQQGGHGRQVTAPTFAAQGRAAEWAVDGQRSGGVLIKDNLTRTRTRCPSRHPAQPPHSRSRCRSQRPTPPGTCSLRPQRRLLETFFRNGAHRALATAWR